MARALRSSERQFEPTFERPFEPDTDDGLCELGSLDDDSRHARALQRQLAEAFAPTADAPHVKVLSLRARLAIILCSASVLWAAIGFAALAILG